MAGPVLKAALFTTALCSLFTTAAYAQDSTVSERIVVTAQKRAQELQSVPLAVSAFDDKFLENQRVDTVDDLIKFTPGFTGYNLGANNPVIPVRGLNGNDFGIGGDATLGIYIDDVFAGRKTAGVQDIYDVKRVEFVRGPQSTLFGRNSTAGAISVVTYRPDDSAFQANAKAKVAEFDHYEFYGVVNIPLAEGVAMRVAGRIREKEGWADNLSGNKSYSEDSTYGGRIALLFEPSDDLEIFLQADGHNRTGTIEPIRSTTIFAPGQSANLFDNVVYDLDDGRNQDDREAYNASAHITYDINENISLTSVTAVRTYNVNFGNDEDGSFLAGLHTFQYEDGTQYTQEFRLNGETGRITWFVGASYIKEKVDVKFAVEYDVDLLFTGIPTGFIITEPGEGYIENDGWAVYGDATIAMGPRMNATLGIRYSHDEKDFILNIPTNLILGFNIFFTPDTGGAFVAEDTSDNALLPRLLVDYHWNDDFMTYASVSRGFRTGGFNTFAFDSAYEPEEVTSYEIGLKSTMFDGTTTFNAGTFYYMYDNLQVLLPVGGAFLVRNAASARGYGLEAELNSNPVAGLNIYSGLMLLNAEYEEFVSPPDDFSGNKLSRAPEVSFNIGGRYEKVIMTGLKGFVGLDITYRSEQFLNPTNDSFRRLDPITLADATVGISDGDDRWSLSVFATNLFDKEHFLSRGGLGFPFYPVVVTAPPRIVGIELTARY